MAETQLKTTSGTGSQATTQSPQAAGSANTGTAAASGVQPGTAQDVLRSNDGIQLHNTPVNGVNLSNVPATTGTTTTVKPETHHINPGLAGFSISLFILAIFLFWLTSRSVKSTT